MLLTEAILSGTTARTNYVLEKEIDYGYNLPTLFFKNSITDITIDFFMADYMTPYVHLLDNYDAKPIIAMKSDRNYFFDTIRYLSYNPRKAS